jgi:pimeloyl-ACP methyl ester carboxylesterase
MAVKSEFIQVNRLQLHYREWGNTKDKHALIFLHGFAATSRIWNEVAEELAKDFRVIALDQRGHGQSDIDPDHDYSRTSQVDDIHTIIELLELETVTLIGHSMGGANAICYAADRPDIVSALVLVETAGDMLRSGVERLKRLLKSGDEFNSLSEAANALYEYQSYAAPDQIHRRALATFTETPDGTWIWNFDNSFRNPTIRPPDPDPGQRRLADLGESAEKVVCPVMIVRGGKTDMYTPESVQRLSRRMANARISLIEEVGHHIPTDDPGTLSLNIREFLQSLPVI